MGMLLELNGSKKMCITNTHHIIRDVTNGSHRLLIKWLYMCISDCGVWLV